MYKRQVPGEQRGALVERFHSDPDCRLFLSTDAGGVGLNPVSYTHLRAHETVLDLVCRLLLEKKTVDLPFYCTSVPNNGWDA